MLEQTRNYEDVSFGHFFFFYHFLGIGFNQKRKMKLNKQIKQTDL